MSVTISKKKTYESAEPVATDESAEPVATVEFAGAATSVSLWVQYKIRQIC